MCRLSLLITLLVVQLLFLSKITFACKVDDFCLSGTPEDVVAINSDEIVLSDLGYSGLAQLKLVNITTGKVLNFIPPVNQVSTIEVEGNQTKDEKHEDLPFYCKPHKEDETFSFHGIDFDSDKQLLLAINFGTRSTVEFFHLSRDEIPNWLGCVELPENIHPNAVTSTENGFVLVSMDNGDEDSMRRHILGKPEGSLWFWNPQTGLERWDGRLLQGGNGIALLSGYVFVSAWSGAEIVVLEEASREEVARLSVDFLPDNLHRLSSDELLLTGQEFPVSQIAGCNEIHCPANWRVVRLTMMNESLDSSLMSEESIGTSFTQEVLIQEEGTESLNYVTGGVIIQDKLFVVGRGESSLLRK
jgi:hypothetical protein